MRLLGKAGLSCLCIAASLDFAFAAAPATPGELDHDVVVELAAEFSDHFLQEGPTGLWIRIQACYKKAMSGDVNNVRNCIVLDEAAKAMDDNRVKATAGAYRNRDWFQDAIFSDRMKTYSAAVFHDPNAYVDFWEKNRIAFGTALRKLNVH